MNLLPAVRAGDQLVGQGFKLPAVPEAQGEVLVGLRPQELRLDADGPLSGVVEAVERLGFDGFAFLKTEAGPLIARFEGLVDVGQTVKVRPVGDALHLFTADGSRALRHPPAERPA